jgi:hypothetical protein
MDHRLAAFLEECCARYGDSNIMHYAPLTLVCFMICYRSMGLSPGNDLKSALLVRQSLLTRV